jgi:hypothetical protein
MVIGAEDHGFDWRPYHRFIKENKIMGEFTANINLDDNLVWLINTYGGSEYDYGTVGVNAIMLKVRWLWKWIGGWLRRNFSKKYKLTCSELVARLLQNHNYPGLKGRDPELINAQQLLIICLKDTEFFNCIYLDDSLKKKVK